MATSQMKCVIQHLRQAVASADSADLDDGRLLESFIRHHDEAAFRALVRQHGPMVMGVCRRLLDNHHDAEDAFQGTFLVLARKAASVKPAARVAQWLHGVARLAALKARRTARKRKAREKQIASLPEPAFVPQDPCQDLRLVLDQEVSHLPQNLRLPLILCDLEGRSIKEATGQLGWPQGTLAGRLARGRKMLAKRLTRKGLVLSAGSVAFTLSDHAMAAIPTSLASSTVNAAIIVAGNRGGAIGAVPLAVATLTEGVLQTMKLSKLRTAGVIVLSVLLVAFGSAFTAQHLAQGRQATDQQENKATAIGKSLALDENNLDGEKRPTEFATQPGSRTVMEVFKRVDPQATANGKSDAPLLEEQKLHGEWWGKGKDEVHLFFGPGDSVEMLSLHGRSSKGTYVVDWTKTPYHLDWNLPDTDNAGAKPKSFQTIMEFTPEGDMRIAASSLRSERPTDFSQSLILAKRKQPTTPKETNAQAANDLELAAFYYNIPQYHYARFYYELVLRHYPGTPFAEQATKAIADLAKHWITLPDGSQGWDTPQAPVPQPAPRFGQIPASDSAVSKEVSKLQEQIKSLERRLAVLEAAARIGPDAKMEWKAIKVREILVEGNKNTPLSAILKQCAIMPGQVLDMQTLRTAERNLAKINATITVIDSNENSDFRDILVKVKE